MRSTVRIASALLFALACSLSLGSPLKAELAAAAEDAAERFTFTLSNAPEDTLTKGRTFQVAVHRWSTDQERDQVRERVSASPGSLLDALRGSGVVGYLHWPGGLDYPLRYARRVARPEGATDVVLVADRPLWLWWDADAVKPTSSELPFTVVQMRLAKDGRGEGRLSLGGGVTTDREAGVMIANPARQPVVLADVRSAGKPS